MLRGPDFGTGADCSGREGTEGPRPGDTAAEALDPADSVEDNLALSCLTGLTGGALLAAAGAATACSLEGDGLLQISDGIVAEVGDGGGEARSIGEEAEGEEYDDDVS